MVSISWVVLTVESLLSLSLSPSDVTEGTGTEIFIRERDGNIGATDAKMLHFYFNTENDEI